MAKLTKMDYRMGGTRLQAQVKVDSSGSFSIDFPPEVVNTLGRKRAEASTLEACCEAFRKGIMAHEASTKKEEKVIVLKVHSELLGKERHPTFGDKTTLDVNAEIFLRTSLVVNGETKVEYTQHPDVSDLHVEHPIPWEFRLRQFDSRRREGAVDIPWTQERQDWLVGLLLALRNICELLGSVTRDTDTLIQNMAKGLLLGAPPKGET